MVCKLQLDLSLCFFSPIQSFLFFQPYVCLPFCLERTKDDDTSEVLMGHKSRGPSLGRVRRITTLAVVAVATASIMVWPCSSITTVGYKYVWSGQWARELVLVMGTGAWCVSHRGWGGSLGGELWQ